jgi:hypothetical protein
VALAVENSDYSQSTSSDVEHDGINRLSYQAEIATELATSAAAAAVDANDAKSVSDNRATDLDDLLPSVLSTGCDLTDSNTHCWRHHHHHQITKLSHTTHCWREHLMHSIGRSRLHTHYHPPEQLCSVCTSKSTGYTPAQTTSFLRN